MPPLETSRLSIGDLQVSSKGAKSVPYKEKSAKAVDFDASQDSFDLGKLPADKNAPVVFYCNGPECWKSYKASKVAAKAGFSAVHWFRGGLPEWRERKLPVNVDPHDTRLDDELERARLRRVVGRRLRARRAGGRSSGVPSVKPPLLWK